MFTGIAKELGIVHNMSKAGANYRLDIESKNIAKSVKIGDSVAVNGVCLTLVDIKNNVMSFDVMAQTVRMTNLTGLKSNDRVNLEDSLKAGDPLGGHFVLGHIDCAGKITDIKKTGGEVCIEIGIPGNFANLIVDKGSIAIDGVSLTIGKASGDKFNVYLIPHTFGTTTLGFGKPGDKLNIEFDILGKYVARLKDAEKGSKITESFLKENGF